MGKRTWKVEDNEVPLFSTVSFLDQGLEAFKMYYDTIGQKHEPTSRLYEHSQPRMALGAALTEHLSDTLVAKILEKDRTTIIHYRKTHNDNLKLWHGYSMYYETAKYICDTYFKKMARQNRIEYIDNLIGKLTQEKLSIQSNV
jgi:hypothetical protein